MLFSPRSYYNSVSLTLSVLQTLPGSIVKTGQAVDGINLINLGETESEWRITAMHPSAETLAKEGITISFFLGERRVSDGRLASQRGSQLSVMIESAKTGPRRVRASLVLGTHPVSDKSQVDSLFFLLDTTVVRIGPSVDKAVAPAQKLSPAPVKRDPNAPLPIKQSPLKPGACPEIGVERGILLEYCPSEDDSHWLAERVWIKMEEKPLAEGNLREAFKTRLWRAGTASDWATKINKLPEDHNRRAYELDVITQTVSSSFTHRYNSKKSLTYPNIAITAAYLLEFCDRPDKPVYAVERFLPGEYLKVHSPVEVATDFSNSLITTTAGKAPR